MIAASTIQAAGRRRSRCRWGPTPLVTFASWLGCISLGACEPAPAAQPSIDTGRSPALATAGEPERRSGPATLPAQPTPPVEPEPLPAKPILDDDIRAARAAAQARQLLAKESPLPDLPPLGQPSPADDPTALPGYFVPLALPARGDPLAPLEAALAELSTERRDAPVRIAVYGASGVAADRWTGYLRAYLQARFGDGGPGIVAAAAPHKWSRHQDIQFERSSNWTKHNAFRLGELAATDYFGIMGQAMSATDEGAWTELTPSRGAPCADDLAFYEVDYLVQPGGGTLAALIDDEPVATITTAGGQVELGRHRIDLGRGHAHTLRLELRGDGPVRLLGVVAETEQPGVIVDTLGVNGAKTKDLRRWDLDLWAEHLRSRAPSLYILAYGNNEAVDIDVPIATYAAGYREVLDRFHAVLPDAGCVMIGPSDYPELVEGEVVPRPRLAQIRAVQAELAASYSCAFLDARAIMGGEGAIAQWVEAGLAREDHLHLRRTGYLRYGMAIGDAIMQRYDLRARP